MGVEDPQVRVAAHERRLEHEGPLIPDLRREHVGPQARAIMKVGRPKIIGDTVYGSSLDKSCADGQRQQCIIDIFVMDPGLGAAVTEDCRQQEEHLSSSDCAWPPARPGVWGRGRG